MMEVRAKLKGTWMAASKGRLVADLIRSRPCGEALSIVQACPKRAARPMEKLLRSALANAEEQNARHSAGIDLDETVDTVKSLREFHPRRLAANLLNDESEPTKPAKPPAPAPVRWRWR